MLHQRALENGDPQNDQDGELVETMEELKPQHGNLEDEKFEDIGELKQGGGHPRCNCPRCR